MDFDISLKFRPSQWFVGILAEMNEQYSGWTDGSYDWAAQTTDFLHALPPLPEFGEALFNTPLSQTAVNDLLHVAVAILAGDYRSVRAYLQEIRFAFVIGYPRSGGSYLTKELLRTLDLDHRHVSEALAHDGFPELREIWYGWEGDKPYFHLQDAVFQVAEFLVIANLYYRRKTARHPHGYWLVPKKMHKIVDWAGSLKMLLGEGRADYLVTIRSPLPTAISIAEKSGGLPDDLMFPAGRPRSAIERWVLADLARLGHPIEQIKAMDYFDAVQVSWSSYHARMASSSLFLGNRDEIRLAPYGAAELEGVVRDYRTRYRHDGDPEAVYVHDKADAFPAWGARAEIAVNAMASLWRSLGLAFPRLTTT